MTDYILEMMTLKHYFKVTTTERNLLKKEIQKMFAGNNDLQVYKDFFIWSGKPEMFKTHKNRTLEYADLLDHVKEMMNRYDLPEGLVQIEITESVGDMDIVLINNIAQSLISMGFRLSMDDFGTKYSNLEMLFKFPFSIAKIDRSLVKNLESNEKSRIMLKHLISMIMELGIECVAEGAENEEQVRLLQQFGCNIIQGYFYSKPVTLDVFTSEFVEKTRNQL